MSAQGATARYAAAAIAVRMADEGARVALVLLATERDGSAALGGVLVAALLVPHVVAAPFVGHRVDRSVHPGRVIAGCAAGFGTALAGASVCAGHVSAPAIVVILLIGGCCGPALTGGLTSQLAALVDAGQLPRAFGVDSLTFNVAGIGGPAAAAALASTISPEAAGVVLGAIALTGAGLIALLPLQPGGSVETDAATGRVSVMRTVRTLFGHRVLGPVTAATTLGQVGAGALPVVVVVVATRADHPAAAGWILAAAAAGGLAGSLVWTWHPAAPRRASAVVMLGLAGTGLPVVAAAVSPTVPMMVVMFAASGVANGPFYGALVTTRQRYAPEEIRGQVFTLAAGLKITFAALGAVLAGVISGASSTLLLCGTGGIPVLAAVAGGAALGQWRLAGSNLPLDTRSSRPLGSDSVGHVTARPRSLDEPAEAP